MLDVRTSEILCKSKHCRVYYRIDDRVSYDVTLTTDTSDNSYNLRYRMLSNYFYHFINSRAHSEWVRMLFAVEGESALHFKVQLIFKNYQYAG